MPRERGGAALRAERLHGLEQADHALLDDVVLVAAQHEILLRRRAHLVLVAGKQNVGRVGVAARGQSCQVDIALLFVLAHRFPISSRSA